MTDTKRTVYVTASAESAYRTTATESPQRAAGVRSGSRGEQRAAGARTPFARLHDSLRIPLPPARLLRRGYCKESTVVRVNRYGWLGVPANLNARISYATWPAT